jgi:hypothetical protein
MSNYPFLDNGFLLLRENPEYASPIGTLNFERYDSADGLLNRLATDRKLIQCVVGKVGNNGKVRFGQTQFPKLWEYADGIDTVDFLLKT